jgi:hypothetical protein
MEHSERGRYVTEQVSLWIQNDGDHYYEARDRAHNPERLRAYLGSVIRRAAEDSAPWYVAQELAPNDWDRVDWAQIAEDLRDQSDQEQHDMPLTGQDTLPE